MTNRKTGPRRDPRRHSSTRASREPTLDSLVESTLIALPSPLVDAIGSQSECGESVEERIVALLRRSLDAPEVVREEPRAAEREAGRAHRSVRGRDTTIDVEQLLCRGELSARCAR